MGRFEKYKGKLKVDLKDGQILDLDFKVEDYADLITAGAVFKSENAGKSQINDSIKLMFSTLRNVLQRSYPTEPKDELEALLVEKFDILMEAIGEKLDTSGKLKKEVKDFMKGTNDLEQKKS